VSDSADSGLLRIGELSRRLRVSDHALRAWERRYGLLRPVRTTGGFRLYSGADLERVRRMQAYLARGVSTAEAARAALAEVPADDVPAHGATTDDTDLVSGARQALTRALDDLDESAAHAVIDRLLGAVTIETALQEVLLPYLRSLGDRWQTGTVSVAQEHFASNVIRGRLAGIARGWGHGHGPRALLACVPGELHDIALLSFGIVLSRQGWQVHFFGADTPIDDLLGLARSRPIDLVVLVSSTPQGFEDHADELALLATIAPLALGGPGSTPAIAERIGARILHGDPVTAAQLVAQRPT